MERQKAILCSNHLVLINVSQRELGVAIESRKCSVYSWSGQNWAGNLGDPGCKGGEIWFMIFRSIFSGSARVGGGCSGDGDEAQSFWTREVGCAWRRQGWAGLYKVGNRGRTQGEMYHGTF